VHGGASDRPLPSHVFVRAPAPRWFPVRHARNAPAHAGDRLLTTVRFASAGRTSLVGMSPRALSSRGDVCRPCLWHPCRLPRDARRARARACFREGRRDRLRACSRERVSRRRTIRGTFRRARAFAPRRSLERPAPAWNRRRGVATAPPAVDDLAPDRLLSDPLELDPRSRARCQRPRFSWVSASLADFCNR